ncbi:DNA recombination protein RmuC [Bullifex porci]|uniref:DNA recombination protein RmuC n=1 Tax=Bullifex porci TaxID=2606638 RepID=A0A7X2TR01_9SPIO|nr:DNA recombination protein RmuC [Bullifex porci]MDD7588003.1 DNA recombination protein RmuC [Bullifex porci]MSU05453.1 DNA recombination protein RmuC [Bullifex porci]
MNISLIVIISLLVLNLLSFIVIIFKIKPNKASNRDFLELEREHNEGLNEFRDSITERFDTLNHRNAILTESINKTLNEVSVSTTRLMQSVSVSMENLRKENNDQLERMRRVVDEKLQETLENRISKSFEQVQKQLEAVYKGLGEMQSLAKNVGDLSKLFTNVKSRGVWGEVQAEAIINEILTVDQFVKNFKPKERSSEVVEFAIKLPGKTEKDNCYLPIDSKFPREDYENYVKASENGNIDEMRYYQTQMKNRVLSEAKDIYSKYINPPRTTDFAILFLPTESLYAEILSIPGFTDSLQTQYRVTIAGPTTLAALINSLQMGFKTLAVEKRSHEVWKLFAAMKKQFGNFAKSVDAAVKSIDSASLKLSDVSSRTQKISSKLEAIELPEEDANTDIIQITDEQ